MITWTNSKRKLKELTAWDKNPRRVKPEQAKRLVESLDEFGQVETIAIEPDNTIIDGHQREKVWRAASQFGDDYEVDVRVASRKLTEQERKKLIVFLHKGAAGEFDFEAMNGLYQVEELKEWGFSEKELQMTFPANPEFKEFDESVVDDIQMCKCEKCGHEHTAKKD
jgi:hypothetical protein